MLTGEELKELRKEKGFSQEEVAKILGVTRQTVSKWEADPDKQIKDSLHEKLSRASAVAEEEPEAETSDKVEERRPLSYCDERNYDTFKSGISVCRIQHRCFGINGDMLIEKVSRLDSRDLIKINAYLDGLLAADKYSE